MENIQINHYYKNAYLTPGETHDNFVITSCPTHFMDLASKLLDDQTRSTTSVVIKITRQNETQFEKTIHTASELQKRILSRDYICTLFQLNLNKALGNSNSIMLNRSYSALISGNFEFAKSCHADCPMPYEIIDIIKRNHPIELNLFLYDTQNKFIQEAINSFLSSRLPLSIKVFTNNEFLPIYQDSSQNLIQSPHDFMTININRFLEEEQSE